MLTEISLAEAEMSFYDFPALRVKNFQEMHQVIQSLRNFYQNRCCDNRPLAILCFPRHAWIDYSRQRNKVSALLGHGWEVIGREVGSETEFIEYLHFFRGYKLAALLNIGGSGL
jgi:hypothetical protein